MWKFNTNKGPSFFLKETVYSSKNKDFFLYTYTTRLILIICEPNFIPGYSPRKQLNFKKLRSCTLSHLYTVYDQNTRYYGHISNTVSMVSAHFIRPLINITRYYDTDILLRMLWIHYFHQNYMDTKIYDVKILKCFKFCLFLKTNLVRLNSYKVNHSKVNSSVTFSTLRMLSNYHL